ncbi:hypothetical protein DM860_010851 [Cuscuta australis]|uniref:Uncharacterized protein n=1 Tax=Cuscuta australis TaxID=267555 RepID=A0A328E416_9ASTE|nr:hypothetical protein DM860_010851 [Cuscuta australis]
MVLRITVVDAESLRETVHAATPEISPMVILIWAPDYLAVQSMITAKCGPGGGEDDGVGENFSTLLKMDPRGFAAFQSTDELFNAVVEAVDLHAVFAMAHDSDTIEFSQSLEVDNGLNEFGYLRARFDRPVGGYMEDYLSLKIYGKCPADMLKIADITRDPSVIPRLRLARLNARIFYNATTLVSAFSNSIEISVKKDSVSLTPVKKKTNPLILNREYGVISTREDIGDGGVVEEVRVTVNMAYMNIRPVTGIAAGEVWLYKRAEDVALLWFPLDAVDEVDDTKLIKGDIIYYLY